MIIMVKMVKRCQHIQDDGFKCNKAFSYSSRTPNRVHCEEHTGSDTTRSGTTTSRAEAGLVRSTNKHAVEGNNQTMREWVESKMMEEVTENREMSKLTTRVKRLEEKYTQRDRSLFARKHVIKGEVKRIVDELSGDETNPQLTRLENLIIGLNNSVIKLERRIEELE